MKYYLKNFVCSFIVLLSLSIILYHLDHEEEDQTYFIMISLDSVYEADYERLVSMPIIQQLVENGAYSTEVTSVYPTVTYAIHTSIVTGTYPDKHGIYHNQPFQPGVSDHDKEWFWYKDSVEVPSLFDLLKENDYKVANLIWPVTGKGGMTYNLPQIFALEGENQAWKTLISGSPKYIIPAYLKYREVLGDGKQPKLDKFITEIAVDTIESKKANFLTLHLISVDSLRHEFGVQAEEVTEGFIAHEVALEKIVQATKNAGIYENTTFVITTDHGQMDVHQNVYLNNVFRREGYITESEEVIDYLAYAQSTGLGAFIYIKNHDPIIKEEVTQLLNSLMSDENYGIEHIYTEAELQFLHASDKYDLAIEALPGYQFKDSFKSYDYKKTKTANHGYSPFKKGYQNIFIISGPRIKNNYKIGPMNIVDIAPTIAELLGLEFYQCDGKSIAVKIS